MDKLLGRAPSGSIMTAAYRKAPSVAQDEALKLSSGQWRDEKYWESFVKRYVPDAGLTFSTSPWVTAWELVWGATPIQDFARYKEMSFKVPYIYSALTLQANLVTAKGFNIKWDGPEECRELLEDFVQKHDMRNMLKAVVYDELRYGSSYIEVVRRFECAECGFVDDRRDEVQKHLEKEKGHELINPYGRITSLKLVDPVSMRVRRNAWGLILGYLQLLTIPPVTLLADEIIHFRFNAMSDSFENAYGNSLLRAILFHQALLDEFEKTMGSVVHSYMKPMLIVKVGAGTPGAPPPTADQYSAVVSAFKNRQPGTDVYVRQGGLIPPDGIQVIQSPASAVGASEWWLKYLTEQREIEMGVPRIFAGNTGGTNRATSQILLQNFTTRLTNIQEGLSEHIENALFIPLLKESYENWKELIDRYGKPQLEWNPIVEEDPVQTLSIVVGLAKIGAITINEARTKLGLSELDRDLFAGKGNELITVAEPKMPEGDAEGAGGFATGDKADEAVTEEKQQVRDEFAGLKDIKAEEGRLLAEMRAQWVDAKKGFDIRYGSY